MSASARQEMQERIDAVNARFRASHGGKDPEQFGLQCCQITQIPAAAFNPLFNDAWDYTGFGYYYHVSGASNTLEAPVQLPTGVEIEYLDLYYYDASTTHDLDVFLVAFSGGTPQTGVPAQSTLASIHTSGAGGYQYAISFLTPPYTVNNNVAYDAGAAQLAVQLADSSSFGASDLSFKAVDLWWLRQVSAPPSTPTFTDVPTNHPFFQFVEALAAADITVGYPDGRFGVDDPITRGQMAVFLAKALGLYWPF